MTLTACILQQILPQPLRFFQRVGSTNDVAKAWLAEGASAGAVVIADEQMRGRGRNGRVWHTPPNAALALSIVLKPPADYAARIGMIGALSVYDLAAQVGCESIGIKWPNDILVRGKKISGVLVESVWERNELIGTALGIGVNVRVDFSQTGLSDTAANLEDVLGVPLDRAELIRLLLERVDFWYQRIGGDEVFDSWRRRLNMLGAPVVVDGLRGIARDVTPLGALLVEDQLGVLREVSAGDVYVAAGHRSAR